jgi:hypothetical protein
MQQTKLIVMAGLCALMGHIAMGQTSPPDRKPTLQTLSPAALQQSPRQQATQQQTVRSQAVQSGRRVTYVQVAPGEQGALTPGQTFEIQVPDMAEGQRGAEKASVVKGTRTLVVNPAELKLEAPVRPVPPRETKN